MINFFKRNKSNNKNVGVVLTFEDLFPDYTLLKDAPEVKTCIDKIADLVSNMTIHLMENTPQGDVRVFNELYKKIDINPHKFMTKKAWLYHIVCNLLTHGNAYVFPQLDSEGLIENLVPLDSNLAKFNWNSEKQNYTIVYGDSIFSSDEIIHFVLNPAPSNPYEGTGYKVSIKDINDTLKLSTNIRKVFLNGKYMPNIIVKVQADDLDLQSEEGRQKIENRYLERNEGGRPWIIPTELMDVQQIKPMTLKDIALNESVELDKRTVAAIFGVPAFFLGVGDFDKEEFNTFISTRIMSIAKIIEQTLTKSLIIKPEWYFKCNPRSLYAYNISELGEIGMKMYSRGAMTGNEVRDWLGLTPIDKLNDLIILENFIKLDDIDKQKKLKGGGNDEGEEI